MAHNLTNANGRIEFAYAGENPWHGLGTKLDGLQTTDGMMRAAGLDWTVKTEPVYLAGSTVEVEDVRAVTRDDNRTVLGMVSTRYRPIQNVQAFDTLDAIVTEGAALVETAGSINDGRQVWALAKLPGTFDVVKGDAVEPYVLVSWGHTGKHALEVRLTPVRVVCNNTLNMATAKRASVSVRHSANANIRIDEAREALGLVRKQIAETVEAFALMARTPLALPGDYFKAIFPAPGSDAPKEAVTRWESQQETLMRLLGAGKGSDIPGVAGSAWGAYNAVTEYIDHLYPVTQNGTVSAARQQSALFGSYADIKAKALDLALVGAADPSDMAALLAR